MLFLSQGFSWSVDTLLGDNILGYRELYLHTWLFVVVDAHLTVVFVIFFMFKESNPLSESVETTIQNDVLGNGDATDVLSQIWRGRDQDDFIFWNLSREWDFGLDWGRIY